MSRWVRVQTSIFNHELFAAEPFTEREAWVWMIMAAAWKDTVHRIGTDVVSVPTGSFYETVRSMQAKWRWKSITRVQNFLKVLERQGMISVKTDTGKSHITICNYSKYQNPEYKERSGEGQAEVTENTREGQAEVTKDTSNTNNTISPIFEREPKGEKYFDLKGFQDWFASWPTSLTDDEDAARSEWTNLSPEQRANVAAETPKYLEGVRQSKRTTWPQASKFLAQRMWERLTKKPPATPKALTPSTTATPEDRKAAWAAQREEDTKEWIAKNESWG